MAHLCLRSCLWGAPCSNPSDFRGAGTLRIPHGFTRRQICFRSRFERQRSALSPRRGRTPKPAGLVAERYLDYLVRRRSLGLCVPRRKNVYRLDVASGKRELVTTLAPTDLAGVTAIQNVRFTPDGKSYAYSFSRELSDLFLVENVR